MEDHGARREGGLRVFAMLGVEGSGSWSDLTTPIDASLGRVDARYLAGQASGGGGGGGEGGGGGGGIPAERLLEARV